MARKIRKGYPLQIYGVIVGNIKYCNDELTKRIDDYIKKHNDLYPKHRDYLKHGIKSHEIAQYQYALASDTSNSYMLSYIVNFNR